MLDGGGSVEVRREEAQEEVLLHVPVWVEWAEVGMRGWSLRRVVYEIQSSFPFLDHPMNSLSSMCPRVPHERLGPLPPR